MPTTYTLGSWAVILAIAGWWFYCHYYTPAHARKAALSRVAAKPNEKKKEPKKLRKIRKDDGQGNAVQESQKEQQKPKPEYTIVANDVEQDEEEMNNREFARQLSSAKTGTLVPAKSQEGARQRSVRQTRAQEKPAVETSSDNGTTGADADDDRSSLNSPELGATTMTSAVSNAGVSDMLEKEAPGPAVLRVTSPTTPAVPKKAKPAAAQQAPESKKQRQNRQKKELAQQVREEQEKERKVLLEKQRRIAREAEGRAAKDGSRFMAAKAPSASAWTAPATNENNTNGNGNKATDAAKADFLDTYDAKAPASQETTQSESELAGSDWQKVADIISEEEQVRRAMEDSDGWKTVSKDKRKKKTQPAPPAQPTKHESNDEDELSDYAQAAAPPILRNPPAGPGQKWGMTFIQKTPDNVWQEFEKDVQDSEWEVA
jgi:hypothetical protein